jgi:hypothetical protein
MEKDTLGNVLKFTIPLLLPQKIQLVMLGEEESFQIPPPLAAELPWKEQFMSVGEEP